MNVCFSLDGKKLSVVEEGGTQGGIYTFVDAETGSELACESWDHSTWNLLVN